MNQTPNFSPIVGYLALWSFSLFEALSVLIICGVSLDGAAVMPLWLALVAVNLLMVSLIRRWRAGAYPFVDEDDDE
jgi:hypothetical protein